MRTQKPFWTIPGYLSKTSNLAVAIFACGFVTLTAQNSSPTGLGASEGADRVRGVVINSVTREPVGRALVCSPDNAFATMTDDRGRFEFTSPGTAIMTQTEFDADPAPRTTVQTITLDRPTSLTARKTGFLPAVIGGYFVPVGPGPAEVKIVLVPESRIIGHVAIPGSDGSDRIQVQVYRRVVEQRREQWELAGTVSTRASGEFRIAGLSAGYYKLLTLEHMDRDPLTANPEGPVFGYPPLYYPAAADFDSAELLHLEAGQTFEPSMSPVRKPYYPVKLGLQDPANPQVGVKVWPQGHPGPGFSLGYDSRTAEIQGLLPDGTYSLMASSYGPSPLSGMLNFTVRGAPLAGTSVTLVPASSVTVKLTEQFQHNQVAPPQTDPNSPQPLTNPRRPDYLQVLLEPDEPFGLATPASIRPPTGPDDDSLVIENVQPGRYRVNIMAYGPGYAAAVTSGGTDLLRQPLVVGLGASISPIEITIRDDGAEIEGIVESFHNSVAPGQIAQFQQAVVLLPKDRERDSIRLLAVNSDGAFAGPQLPPGTYAAMAVEYWSSGMGIARDAPLADTGYENEQFLKKYDSKIQVIQVAPHQKLHLRLALINVTE